MARQYSTRDFFRQMPNTLLARYFEARGVLGELDFRAMKDTQPDELLAAWLKVLDDRRNPMDAELLEIFDMSCEKGSLAIMDEAAWQLRADPETYTEFAKKLSGLANHYERAMVRKRVQAEKDKRTKGFLRIVAQEESISVSRLKQLVAPTTVSSNIPGKK